MGFTLTCPKCGPGTALFERLRRGRPVLECARCHYQMGLPADEAMRRLNAPRLPGFAMAVRP